MRDVRKTERRRLHMLVVRQQVHMTIEDLETEYRCYLIAYRNSDAQHDLLAAKPTRQLLAEALGQREAKLNSEPRSRDSFLKEMVRVDSEFLPRAGRLLRLLDEFQTKKFSFRREEYLLSKQHAELIGDNAVVCVTREPDIFGRPLRNAFYAKLGEIHPVPKYEGVDNRPEVAMRVADERDALETRQDAEFRESEKQINDLLFSWGCPGLVELSRTSPTGTTGWLRDVIATVTS